MSVVKIQQSLDLKVLKQYALITTGLFIVLLVYTLISLPPGGLFQALPESPLQSMSTVLFILVLGSSLAGVVFNHTVKFRPRTRNAFAFVFSMSSLKFVGTLLAFQVLGF
ncbi:MAG: hypothetical protein HKN87_13035 [Saprospiraceae bacterium]|nr:hypothetical protein [Saprospiraceae bacterium]